MNFFLCIVNFAKISDSYMVALFRKIFVAGLTTMLITALSAPDAFGQKLETIAPSVVAKGKQFNVEYRTNVQPTRFNTPEFENFRLIGSGTSRSVSSDGNGVNHAEYIFTFVLVALQEGNFSIPAASMEVDGKTYTSRAQPIEVVDEGGGQGASGQGASRRQDQAAGQAAGQSRGNGMSQSAGVAEEEIFLRAIPDKTTVFRGEPVRVRFKLFTRVTNGLREEGGRKMPSFNGFWQQNIDVAQYRPQTERYNSRVYTTYVMAEYLLYPTQSGSLKIDPLTMNLVIEEVQRPTGGGSIWDDFMGGFPEIKETRKSISSPVITITVKDLPADAPASFTGAVGNFTMTAENPEPSMYVNSASSFRIRISGTGNIPLMQGPKIEMPASFEQHNSKMTEDTRITPAGISGSRQFEYPFIARAQGEFTIDPVKFSYFNPQTGEYATLSTKELSLTVVADTTGGPTSPIGIVGGLSREEVKILNKDIRFIKHDAPNLRTNGKMLMCSTLYFAIAGLLIAAAVFLYVYLRRRIEQMRDDALVRGRKANKVVLTRLKAADEYMKEGNRHKFHDEMLKALWGYLSDKLNIPVANLTKENVREKLLRREIPAEWVNRYTDLISECEYAQYSPAESSPMQEKYKAAVEVITKMESYIKK